MDSSAITFAITICLLGSSAAGYVFGVLSNQSKTIKLEHMLTELLEDPICYENARDQYLATVRWHPSNNGRYVPINK